MPKMSTHKEGNNTLWSDRWNLFCNASINLRYYRKREWFFDKCEKTCNLIALMGGSAVIGNLTKHSLLVGILIALAGAAPLVFDLSGQRALFRNLISKMMEVLCDIECHNNLDNITADWIEQTKRKMNSIEASEPPSLRTLVIICEAEFFDLIKHEHAIKPVGRWRRFTAYFGG